MGQEGSKGQSSLEVPSGGGARGGPFQQPQPVTAEQVNSLKTFTAEEVGLHNKPDDAWLIYNGFVFDITEYQHDHPGGGNIILARAGKDATADFDALFHSAKAKQLLRTLIVGRLVK